MKKKIWVLSLIIFFVFAGNAFAAMSFGNVELWTEHRPWGWRLWTDVSLVDEATPGASTVTYSSDGGSNLYGMAHETWGSSQFYIAYNVLSDAGWTTPTSAHEQTFLWRADDGTTSLEVSGVIPMGSMKEIDLSYEAQVLSNDVTPTIEWYNDDLNVNQYRVKVFEGGSFAGHENVINSSADHIVHEYTGFPFVPGNNYSLRIEARAYDDDGFGNPVLFPLDDVTGSPVGSIGTFNRSSLYLDFNPVPVPGAVWLLGSGLIGLVGFRRKFKK